MLTLHTRCFFLFDPDLFSIRMWFKVHTLIAKPGVCRSSSKKECFPSYFSLSLALATFPSFRMSSSITSTRSGRGQWTWNGDDVSINAPPIPSSRMSNTYQKTPCDIAVIKYGGRKKTLATSLHPAVVQHLPHQSVFEIKSSKRRQENTLKNTTQKD